MLAEALVNNIIVIAPGLMARGLVLWKILLGIWYKWPSFRTVGSWSLIMLSVVSGASPCDSSALPGHETVKRLATIATEYVVVKQGMCVEWGKHA